MILTNMNKDIQHRKKLDYKSVNKIYFCIALSYRLKIQIRNTNTLL